MANVINLQELEHELSRTKGMFEQWSAAILQRAQACNASHIARLRAGKGGLTCSLHLQQVSSNTAAKLMLVLMDMQASWLL